ncbi:MerR family transcriptional regulator [Streptomyces sp. HNM0663]|uniref:MerR family transcriptional regulator n=1 Tax=Streptomyces chengmaiensis TaxID=3040919 RepID=A0ABT6HL33_9ACTN|nr:MerR family transcriptional regulator [Streptomyces chengmaiensis]MDH2388749.1 MerR family transcriptional regulator [Streptomyces chengmaiensis]
MFTIGDFARHGRVSARMLRHYDAIGLLRPARTDPFTGYRRYAAAQLADLNRIIALKDLGFSLEQVRQIRQGRLDTAGLRGMLTLRRAELEAARAAAEARLTRVEARLRSLESEGRMPSQDVVVKSLPAVRVAELTAVAAGYEPEHISPVIRPLYEELCKRLDAAGVTPSGPGIAYYEACADAASGSGADEGAIVVHAAMTVSAEPAPGQDFAIVDLPAVGRAATIVHRGPMDEVVTTGQALARWIDEGGHRSAGYAREVTLEWDEDPRNWVTELQEPLV